MLEWIILSATSRRYSLQHPLGNNNRGTVLPNNFSGCDPMEAYCNWNLL